MKATTIAFPIKRPPISERTKMDTMFLNAEVIAQWKLPPFQRPLRVNEKVREIAADIKRDGVVPGVITLGLVETGSGAGIYIVDGQHRVESFRISEAPECLADVRIVKCDNFGEMGALFVELNSSIVRMMPDDVLRGLESQLESLQIIRRACPFVGYSNIRRQGTGAPILSMSALLRCWSGAAGETPSACTITSARLAQDTPPEIAARIAAFLSKAFAAWGREPGNWRLWSALNLTLCMWLWRRIVIEGGAERTGLRRHVLMSATDFTRCLMSLSASIPYVDWLLGRHMSERDRGPAYSKIKVIFAKRMQDEHGTKILLPREPWESR